MKPNEIQLSAGQTVLVWGSDNVITKRETMKSSARLYIRGNAFVGTEEEVEDLISKLGLTKKQ